MKTSPLLTLDRRAFLAQFTFLLAGAGGLSACTQQSPGLFISAASDTDNNHWVAGFTLKQQHAELLFQQPLPDRGHHVAVSRRHGIYVAVARRPGTWLVLGDAVTGAIHAEITVPANRHVFGHGLFSADELKFYTTESDYQNMTGNSGLVVEWDVVANGGKLTLERKREFATKGVDPHELLLMPDGDTLVIANGGMRTHPDSEREVLNADTMLPSLVYLDRHTGQVLEQNFLPDTLHQDSIHHLDVNADGLIALGMQFQGEPFLSVPLVATHRRGEELRLLQAPADVQSRMQQYVGSVRFTEDGRYFAASCPRGNLLTFWDAGSGELVHSLRARDGCGVCALGAGFLFSSGIGNLAAIDLDTLVIEDFVLPEPVHLLWDNHLAAGRLS